MSRPTPPCLSKRKPGGSGEPPGLRYPGESKVRLELVPLGAVQASELVDIRLSFDGNVPDDQELEKADLDNVPWTPNLRGVLDRHDWPPADKERSALYAQDQGNGFGPTGPEEKKFFSLSLPTRCRATPCEGARRELGRP